MRETFLITGATGKVGSAVARALAAQGIRARLAHHAAASDIDSHDVVPFDYDDPATIRAALDGVDGLFLLTPPSNRQTDWAALTIDLAMGAGVDRIVRLSVAAAPLVPGIQLGRWHRMTERYLQASGARWTIVRPVPYMQNFLGMYSTADDGALTAPLGDGAISYVDAEDVGRFCAWALQNDDTIGEIYTVTGNDVLPTSDAVATLETALGTAIAYRPAAIGDWRRQMAAGGAPDWFVNALAELFTALGSGAVSATTSTLANTLPSPPTSFTDFAARDRDQLRARFSPQQDLPTRSQS